MNESGKGTVIVISSHVVRGTVGNRAAVFALETLGHPVWALPTVILPWHPGHGRATRVAISSDDFDAIVSDLIRAPWRGEVKAVLSGYLGSAAQARSVARLVESLRADNPDLLYMCDPVCGDDRGLYVPEETATAIRDNLIPLASIATPNRFELAWLTGTTLETNAAIIDAAGQGQKARDELSAVLPLLRQALLPTEVHRARAERLAQKLGLPAESPSR